VPSKRRATTGRRFGEEKMNAPEKTAVEACKVLDALAALSLDLACHCDVPPHTMILPASKVREACDAIDEAVAALRRILAIADASGDGSLPHGTQSAVGEDPTP
jgi:hypothetical protein